MISNKCQTTVQIPSRLRVPAVGRAFVMSAVAITAAAKGADAGYVPGTPVWRPPTC